MNPLPLDHHNEEPNLFQFHFDSMSTFGQQQSHNTHIQAPSLIIPNHTYHHNDFYNYFSDNTPTNCPKQEDATFSSPQLKPKQSPLQRKRFKTIATSNYALSPLGNRSQSNDQGEMEPQKEEDNEDEDEDDDESGSDAGSNDGSVGSNKKRGKYKVYTETEKQTILNFMMKHGVSKTLEIFSNNTHKITKRKLKSWAEGQYKIKGVKGRKTNDPNRDQTLYDWCLQFQRDEGRAPTRKEATKKALELSEDPTFQASKGWLDKFSRKYNIEFTPLKIIPPKNKKKIEGFLDDNSDSHYSGSDTSSVDGMSPLMKAMQNMQPIQSQKEAPIKQWSFENKSMNVMMQNNNSNTNNMNSVNNIGNMQNHFDLDGHNKINDFFDFGNNNQTSGMVHEKHDAIPSFEQGFYNNNNYSNNQYNAHSTPQQTHNNYQFDSYFNYQNYQPNFQVNLQAQNNNEMGHFGYSNNQQLQIEPNSFLNFGNSHQNDNNNNDDDMKLEYQY